MRLPPETEYPRDPLVERGLSEFLSRWGDEAWFLDARQVSDAAGARLEVDVDPKTYQDQLPRRLGCGCYLVVRPVTKTPKTSREARALAMLA